MKVKYLVKKKISQGIVIFGVPGIGNVGKISLDFLIDSLKAKKITEIISYNLPNCVFVEDDNTLDLPKFEIYHKKVGVNDLLFVTGDIQPSDEKGCYEFCEGLVDLFGKMNVKEIVTLGGIGLEELPKKLKVFVSGTDKKINNKYKIKGVRNGVESLAGPVVGMVGVLLGMGKEKNIPGVCLLSETLAHPSHLGVHGAKGLIKVLNDKFNLKIDTKELDEEVKEIEEELKEKVEKILPLEEKKVKKGKISSDNISYIG